MCILCEENPYLARSKQRFHQGIRFADMPAFCTMFRSLIAFFGDVATAVDWVASR